MARKRVESATSAEAYFNKLYVQFKGRGYDDAGARAAALAALARRYEHFGVLTAAHAIVRSILKKNGIDPVFSAVYMSFVNAYLAAVQKGHLNDAEAAIRRWREKGADEKILREIVDTVGEIVA